MLEMLQSQRGRAEAERKIDDDSIGLTARDHKAGSLAGLSFVSRL